jgi:predicted nucleic acid-binding protein
MSKAQNSASEVVFDANLWLNIALAAHPYHAQATQLLTDCLASGVDIIAPALWEIEADSSLRMMRVRKEVNARAELAAQQLLNAAPVRVEYHAQMRLEAQRIADQLKQPRVYDATYTALAHWRGCELWTADQRLFNAAQAVRSGTRSNVATPLTFVRFVGSYAGEYAAASPSQP